MPRTRGKPTTKLMMAVTSIDRSDARYPSGLRELFCGQAPDCIFTLGDLDLLRQKTLALFCSVKCPGNLILQTYDLARQLRDGGIVVISGFHSPMEKECLSLLLRGKQPIVWCPARRLTANRLRKEYAKPISEGRLLMLSPFGERVKRATQEIARFRNEFVAALADEVFIAYAAPGSKTESFCQKVLGWTKPLLTFETPSNAALLASGARPYTSVGGGYGGGRKRHSVLPPVEQWGRCSKTSEFTFKGDSRMDALEALYTRRSVRRFKTDPVERSKVEKVVEAGRLAATANNLQPWEFVVVTDEARRKEIAGITDYGKFITQSPVCIVTFCKETKYFLEDGSAATQNMLVAARALGLGSCWVAGDKKAYADRIRALLGVPVGYKLISLIAVGHPAEPPGGAGKRSLKELLHWERYGG